MAGMETMCEADVAVGFAYLFDNRRVTAETGASIIQGPATYREMVAGLQALPEDSGFVWHQELMGNNEPFTPELGKVTRAYEDGSSLDVIVRTKPLAWVPRQFEIATSLWVSRPGQEGKQVQIDYDLDPGSTRVQRRVNYEYAQLLGRITGVATALAESDLSEERLGLYLDVAVAEAGLMSVDVHPDTDDQVAAVRSVDPVYRGLSDAYRASYNQSRAAEAQQGPDHNSVGQLELQALSRLLLSL